MKGTWNIKVRKNQDEETFSEQIKFIEHFFFLCAIYPREVKLLIMTIIKIKPQKKLGILKSALYNLLECRPLK